MGEVTDSTDPADFDDTTIAGAIETIISYVQETFGCRLCSTPEPMLRRKIMRKW